MLAVALLVLGQAPSASNQWPVQVRQNGVVQSAKRAWAVDCTGGAACSADGGMWYLSVDAGGVSTETTAAMTLYVDPNGDNSNACTSSGDAGCRSLNGAFSKLPDFLRHSVTIYMAAGTYDAGFSLDNVSVNGLTTLSVIGSYGRATLDSGTAFGDITSYDAGSGMDRARVYVAEQNWTPGDLRGKFMRFRSGPASNTAAPITDNTADTVIFPGDLIISPAAGNGWEVVVPTTVLTGSVGGTVGLNTNGGGSLALSWLDMSRTSGNTLWIRGPLATSLTNSIIRATSGNGISLNGALTMRYSVVDWASTGSGVAVAEGVFKTSLSVYGSYFHATNAAPLSGVLFGSGTNFPGTITETLFRMDGNITGASLYYYSASQVAAQLPNVHVECLDGGTGIWVGEIGHASESNARLSFNGGPFISGCDTGVRVGNESSVVLTGAVIADAGVGVSLGYGGRAAFLGGTPTMTNVTTPYSVDGTTYTQADLDDAGVITGRYGSRLIK